MNNKDLIAKAASYVNSTKTEGGLLGDVACALISKSGVIYVGVCASVGSNTFCAETNAIGSMISEAEFEIKKIVAVWKNEKDEVFVISPCGNCRQLMYEVHPNNLQTIVLLDRDKEISLKDLLPHYSSWKKQD
ncbi:MAG: cytidine deaminase [Candidatus Cloacimonetes bacterium]|nr:cytidine deaminase [Candidatus Cloacimonadota bacterium]